MSGHCPQDGGFMGDAGCTHPNHQHSEFVKSILEAKTPRTVSPADCDRALREGFYVNSADGKRVGFGRQLAEHMAHHNPADKARRRSHLLYAVSTVKSGRKAPNPKGGPGSSAYAKRFGNMKVLVLTDSHGQVEDVFNIIPKRGGK